LLWGGLGFVALQLGLALAMELWLPQLRDLEFASKLSRLQCRRAESPSAPLVLMLGSSRAMYGFQPECLSGKASPDGRPILAFNFALAGAGPMREWLCLRSLLERGLRPDLLLVEVIPLLLNDSGPERQCEENWLYVPALAATDVSRLQRFSTRPTHLTRTWLRARLVPEYTLRANILGWLDHRWLLPSSRPWLWARMDRWGWVPQTETAALPPPQARQEGVAFSRRYFLPALSDYRIGTEPARALADLLELCQREKVPALLVLMPEGPEFRSWYTTRALSEIDQLLAGLRRTYSVGLIDARTWVPEEGFLDSHHLLPAAATEFSARLAGEVLRYWRHRGKE
jgi:hypothetical protein